jgi:16S rRNA (guanine966-N2)-methyltransferase
MRIVAGELRGRRLFAPNGHEFRPTTDRVKETMFNILNNRVEWDGARVCDLFAGSGSLGLEALSRGAARATFVENDRSSLDVLRRNIEALGVAGRCSVEPRRVETYLDSGPAAFDVIFADPPYRFEGAEDMLRGIADGKLLAREGILCYEHHTAAAVPRIDQWIIVDGRGFGTTTVTFMSLSNVTAEEPR